MATPEDYRHVLTTAVERLRAKAARVDATAGAYEEGRQMAYFEALQTVLEAAELVGMTAADVGLEGLRPAEMIGLRAA